ncbi:MAG: polysaccharide biosynthesis/export family protein, partial [Deltaproteobacteria bacterium]|nr:polysaccharide biosynthesis/export family protein [Deltaproteobacteria bacterium]
MRRKKDNFKVLKGTTQTSMKISKRSSLLLITMLLISCARYPTIPSLEEIDPTRAPSPLPELFQEKAPALLPEREATQKDYVIGPEDVLKIQVWDHPDMDREVHVSREGEFSYPLIGKVHANGLTVVELEKEITRRLDISYIINPQVTVAVNQFHSKKVFFLGEVVTRGTYPLTG